MLRQILRAQWMTSRMIVVFGALLAFAIPLGSVYYGGDLESLRQFQVSSWLVSSRTIGQAIPFVALGLGVLLGMATWAPDHQGRHVYALSLPIERWRYVLLRFVAGLVMLVIPVLALGAGAALAAFSISLPSGIHAYPLQLTARFALSALVMFAIFFSISAATKRAVVITLSLVGGVVVSDLIMGVLGSEPVMVSSLFRLLTTFPGPLSILLGRWALFDV